MLRAGALLNELRALVPRLAVARVYTNDSWTFNLSLSNGAAEAQRCRRTVEPAAGQSGDVECSAVWDAAGAPDADAERAPGRHCAKRLWGEGAEGRREATRE